MVQIDLNVHHEHSLERTKFAVRVWADTAKLLAAAVSKGRGLESPADLFEVFDVMREGIAHLSVFCQSAQKWVTGEVEAARVGVSGPSSLDTDTVIRAVTLTLGQLSETAGQLFSAMHLAQGTIVHVTPAATVKRLAEKRRQELGRWADPRELER